MLELVHLIRAGNGSNSPGFLVLGCAVACVVGLASLLLLIHVIKPAKAKK